MPIYNIYGHTASNPRPRRITQTLAPNAAVALAFTDEVWNAPAMLKDGVERVVFTSAFDETDDPLTMEAKYGTEPGEWERFPKYGDDF